MALTIEAFGEVRVCTSSMEPLFDLNIEKVSLKNILNTGSFKAINKSFDDGVFPRTCRSCEKVEKLGVPSKREIFNEKRKNKWGEERIEEILIAREKKPLHLSVGFSNKCNLQCTMCSSKYSSMWGEDEAIAKERGLLKRNTYPSFNLSKENLSELLVIASEASDIFIKGGEPFFNEEVFVFLDGLRSSSKKPHIFIQTNGTLINKRIMSLIEELNIEIGISIDGVFDTYEWIRGFPYLKVRENILKFAALNTDHCVSLDYTSSLFNTMDLKSTCEELGDLVAQNEGISHLSLVSIARQVENDLRNLPLFVRQPLSSIILENQFSTEAPEVLLKVITTEQLNSSAQNIARNWIRFLEEKRGAIPSRKFSDFEKWMTGGNDGLGI